MLKNRIVLGGLAAATLVGGGLAANAATASPSPDNAQGVAPSAAHAKKAVTPIRCDGGRVVNMNTRIVNTPFTFSETGVNAQDQTVPGVAVGLVGPRRGTDTVLVTVSAETQLTGGDTNDWMGLEVHRNGVPIQPFTAAGDVLAFTSEPGWNANSIQFCTKIRRGANIFQVKANLQDNSGAHSLNGWLDDLTVSYVRFD